MALNITLLQVTFFLAGAITIFSAVMVVSAPKMLHAGLWLVAALFGVAMLFAMLQASFFAVVQVLVYIGAIAILIIFAVMLTRRMMDEKGAQLNKGWWVAAVAAAALFAGLLAALGAWAGFQEGPGAAPDTAVLTQFGIDLVDPSKFAIPFEVASILLLAALVGAIYIAADKKGGKG